MSPLDTHRRAIWSSSIDGPAQRKHTTRPRRPDFNELAAEEYRRALRSLLQAKGEHQYRLAA